jgi:hypothetical protein
VARAFHDAAAETSIMSRKTALLAIVMLITFTAGTGVADTDPCPCVVLGYTWHATPCETWNCAASALVLANGDPYTMVLPTTDGKVKWVVLKRDVSGGFTESPDAPVIVERFNTMTDGSSRFAAVDQNKAPLLVTATDGNVLVVYLRQGTPRQHSVGH